MGRNNLRKQNDPLGTSLVNEEGKVTKVLKRCPHCGMVDYRNSSQGIEQTHHNIWTVGGIRYYQCGKCRKYFYTLEVQVPLDTVPLELYKILNEAISLEAENEKEI